MDKVMTPEEKEVERTRDQVTARAIQMIDHILDHGVLLTSDTKLTAKGLKVAQLIDGMLRTMQTTIAAELDNLFRK